MNASLRAFEGKNTFYEGRISRSEVASARQCIDLWLPSPSRVLLYFILLPLPYKLYISLALHRTEGIAMTVSGVEEG